MISQPCRICKIERPIVEFYKNSTKGGYYVDCKACTKIRRKKHYWENREAALAYIRNDRLERPVHSLVREARSRAKKRGMEFSITVTDVEIPTHCPVLGIELVVGGGNDRGPKDNSPSLDRIENSKGYVPGNVVVVSHRANRLKSDGTLDELRKVLNFYERLS